MIYAINKRTKEHKVVDVLNQRFTPSPAWYFVYADPDGWIEWYGGECPLPDGCPVSIRGVGGQMESFDNASMLRREAWIDRGIRAIEAYRPILDAEPEQVHMGGQALWQDAEGTIPVTKSGQPVGRVGEPEAPEWDGPKDGLPPVGCECEYYDAIQEKWMPASIVAHHINGEEAIWSESLAGGNLFYGTPRDFRPIRSEEDRAVEEMARIIADGHDVYIGAHEAAQRLYRAGYRKTGGE